MGTFRYPIVLCSRDGTWERRVDALVDTGATYTWVPRPILEELGYKPSFKRRLRLADGKVIERDGCEVVATATDSPPSRSSVIRARRRSSGR